MKKSIVAVSLALGLALGQAPVLAASLANLPDFTPLVKKEGRAVVNISTKQTVRQNVSPIPDDMAGDPFFEFFRRFAPPQQREFQAASLGSGFILSPAGYIMTNAHVVARADEITVTLTDKRSYKARLVGADARTDVALLKIDGKDLPVIDLGDPSSLEVGEWVVAIGSPFGFDNSVTAGIVSAKGRQLPDENYVPFIQTDVAVNPGNSGGPRFNMQGQVVGINSQIYSRSGGFMGISFAIPIDVAVKVSDQLKASGRVSRGRIGVQIQELTKELAASFGLPRASGALVNAVEPGGPAEKAGLKAGDIILKVNGSAINSTSDLPRLIGSIKPGQATAVEVWRNRGAQSVTVVPDELRESDDTQAERAPARPREAAPKSQPVTSLGLVLADAPPALLGHLGVRFALVVQRATGAAARAGLVPGDAIVGIGNDNLTSFAQLKGRVDSAPSGSALPLRIVRNGATLFLALPISKP